MPDVPIQPAATIVVVTDAPRLQVALLQRRQRSEFVGGMWVFPGGGVDDHDRDPRWANTHPHPEATLPVRDAHAHWIAAIRETWEEADLFLGTPTPPAALRQRVDAGAVSFHDAVRGAALDQSDVVPIGRWITPRGSPRRYDTIFFVASIPSRVDLTPDGTEAVAAEWISPAAALEQLRVQTRTMLPPTSVTLEVIATYPDTSSLMRAARSAAELSEAHRLQRLDNEPSDPQYFLPEDEAPELARPAEGWMSLGRFEPEPH